MRVVIITNYWKNSEGGGIKTYLVNLVSALKDKGADVSVLFRWGKDPEQFCGGDNKIVFSFACYRQLKKIRPAVIHTHGPWYCLLPGVFYKKLHGCTLVHTFHTDPDKKLPYLGKIFFQNLLDACDCVTFDSKRLKERIIDVCGLSFSGILISYGGVRAGEVSDEEVNQFKEHYGIDEDAVILVAIGMTAFFNKAEGLKIMIRAIRVLQETHPKIVLIVTRDGKYSEDVKACACEMGTEKHIIFTGNVENPFVPLKLSDIFTHITLGDGLPLALLEAMSMGKPIVATPIGGIPEAIINGENGILVEPEIEQIVREIDYLLQNQDYAKKLGICAKKTVEEKFTWEQAAERFLQCYLNCKGSHQAQISTDSS